MLLRKLGRGLACGCLLCLFFLTSVVTAAPRIGLVLGGGGARGFAHLGVLEELERLHVPIACIAGTSAGALIGGIYASGVPLDEIKRTFASTDWAQVMSGRTPRSSVPYERKRDDYKNYFDLTLGVGDGGLRVPRSAINSQEIDLLLHKLTRNRSLDSFDQLPIPFRAVATDLETGNAVVFDHGSLARALRASMAVPGVFDLVEYEGRLLVDGMLARNLPVQDIKGRCADRVIVVDVSSPLVKKEQIHSLFDVLQQTSNIATERNVREQLALLGPDDIVIRPALDDYGTADFDKHKTITQLGRDAVRPLAAKLAALALSPAQYASWHARLKPVEAPLVDAIQVADTRFVNHEALESKLQPNGQAAQPLASVHEKLADVFADGDYDQIGYRLLQQNGKTVMTVQPLERAIGPNYLRFGLSLKGSAPGDTTFALLASHDRTWLNSAGAVWRNSLYLGEDKSFRSELFQPLGATSPVFVAPSLQWSDTMLPVFAAGHTHLADLGQRIFRLQFDGGVQLGRYGEFRLGMFSQHEKVRYVTGDSIADRLRIGNPGFLVAGVETRLVLDQFDNPRWPRHGYMFDGRFDSYQAGLGSDMVGRAVGAVGETAFTYGDTTVRLTGKYRANLSALDPLESPQMLGGFLNLSGYQQNELVGQKVALLRMMAYQRVASLPPALGSGLYLGGSLELGKLWQPSWGAAESGWLPGASLFLGGDTLLGPFFVGLGHAQGGVLAGYLFLGVDY
jgi:NTE family protein